MRLVLLFNLMLVLISFQTIAKNVQEQINLGFKTTFASKILNEERELWINLPENYSKNRRYPVIYLLDGARNFAHTTAAVNYLPQAELMPEVIVVGIASISSSIRWRDFTPSEDPNHKGSGRANQFLDFLALELVPHIEKEYSTEKFKIISGSSLAGLFVLHSFHTKPDLFQAHFAYSPSLFYNDRQTTKDVVSFLKNTKEHKNYVYINIGDEGLKSDHPSGIGMRSSVKEIMQALDSTVPKGLIYKVDFFDNEKHITTPVVGNFQALRDLYEPWYVPFEQFSNGLNAIIEYYDMLSNRFNYAIKPLESLIDQAGFYQLRTKDSPDEAIALFKLNIKNYPRCIRCYDSLAYAYQQSGQLDHAILELNKALSIKGIDSDQLATIKKRKKEVLDAQNSAE